MSRRGIAVSRLVGITALASALAGTALVAPAHAAPIELNLWPAGQGHITVTQGGAPHPTCHFIDVVKRASPCVVTVDSGSPVTLAAVAEPGASFAGEPDVQDALPDFPVAAPRFVRWSRFDCGASPTCTFIPAAEHEWVTALFTPLQLAVGINPAPAPAVAGTVGVRHAGGVTPLVCDGRGGFGEGTCHALLPADADVALVATPANPQDPVTWGEGCETPTGSPASPTCTVSMTNLRTFASVAFGDPAIFLPPDFPFQITPRVRVATKGTGRGSITGSGLDCGTKCFEDFRYQERVKLTATASAGSSFVRWVGVCSTSRTCAFSAGSATSVVALFAKRPAPQPPAFSPRVVSISVSRRGRRVIHVVVRVNRSAAVKLRLLRRGRSTTVRSFHIPAGQRTLRVAVPRSARRGTYKLRIGFTSGAASRTRTYTVRLRR
jgi:hypothetical protein